MVLGDEPNLSPYLLPVSVLYIMLKRYDHLMSLGFLNIFIFFLVRYDLSFLKQVGTQINFCRYEWGKVKIHWVKFLKGECSVPTVLCPHIAVERSGCLCWVLIESICMRPCFSKKICQSPLISSEETRKRKTDFLIHVGLLLAALGTEWCIPQKYIESPAVSCLFIPTEPVHFIYLSVMLLRVIFCPLNLISDKEKKIKKKKVLNQIITICIGISKKIEEMALCMVKKRHIERASQMKKL